MCKYYSHHEFSVSGPLFTWNKKDILAQVPPEIIMKLTLDSLPENVLQELLLAQVGEITDLFGTVEPAYAVDLTNLPKLHRSDVWDVYEPYISKQKRLREKAKWEAIDQSKEAPKSAAKQATQEKLFDPGQEFSTSDPTIYFATVEYYKSIYSEELGHYTYAPMPTRTHAVILAGMIYIGSGKNCVKKRVTSKRVKVLESRPGSLYGAPSPYNEIIDAHPEIEMKLADIKAKERKARIKKEAREQRELEKMQREAEKAKKAAEREAQRPPKGLAA